MTQFNTIYSRKGTKSIKWDALQDIFKTDDVLPMWVADMDFPAPQAVLETLNKRIQHGIFGYTMIDQEVKQSIVNWLDRRHQWKVQTEWLTFSPGVVTSLHIAIQALTSPKDKVLIQTPVYTPFYNVIKMHDRIVVKNSLIYENGTYRIDFNDLEQKLKDVQAFILCSPHNPVGRVWKKAELNKIATLCEKHDVLLISDEIHADLIYPNHKHTPIASLSEEMSMRTITCMSPSKTFNLAGLQASYIVTENPVLKKKIDTTLQKQGLSLLNTLGTLAMEAAYSYGEAWLDELLNVLEGHVNYVIETLETNTDLRVVRPEGTYLLWIDCKSLGLTGKDLHEFMIKKAKVGLNAGFEYGVEGEQFMRINIACPKETLQEGINRIINAVQSYE